MTNSYEEFNDNNVSNVSIQIQPLKNLKYNYLDSKAKTWRTNNDDDSTEDRRYSKECEYSKRSSNSHNDFNSQSKINELNIKLRESEIDN